MKRILLTITINLFVFLSSIQQVDARAFCALRDPVSTIKLLFPESTHHRSVVKAINSEVRDRISSILPFTLHFNELGKHTLYVVENNANSVGYVHVRSELTKWGLVEIAWGLKPDLTIRSVHFQRCRIPDCDGVHLENVLELTVGKSYGELIKLIEDDGKTLVPEVLEKISDPSAASFSLDAIKSAIKTMVVTSITWEEEVANINRKLLLEESFGVDKKISLNAIEIPANRFNELEKLMGGGGSMVDRESIKAFQLTFDGRELGTLVSANWKHMKFEGMFNWLFDTSGKILAIQPYPAWPNDEVSQSFEELHGAIINNEEQCNTAAQLIAYELYYLSHDRTTVK